MNALEFVTANWKTLSGIIAVILTWHKDAIMNKLNIRQKKADVSHSERSVDTVYIENSEKLVEIYASKMDDLNRRHREDIEDIRNKHCEELREIKLEHAKNIDEFRAESKKMREETDIEKQSLKETVIKLQKEVAKLTEIVKKLGRQIAFYKQHSDLELPDNLQD